MINAGAERRTFVIRRRPARCPTKNDEEKNLRSGSSLDMEGGAVLLGHREEGDE